MAGRERLVLTRHIFRVFTRRKKTPLMVVSHDREFGLRRRLLPLLYTTQMLLSPIARRLSITPQTLRITRRERDARPRALKEYA